MSERRYAMVEADDGDDERPRQGMVLRERVGRVWLARKMSGRETGDGLGRLGIEGAYI